MTSPTIGMSRWHFFLLLLLKIAMVVSLNAETREFTYHEEYNTDSCDIAQGRHTRTLPSIFGPLLKGAQLIFNKGSYRLFSKSGGLAQARHDFYALDLENVRKSESGLEASMDDKMVIFRKGSRIYGDGVIDIWSLREGTTEPFKIDRIRYSLIKRRIPGQINNSLKDR